MYNRYVSQKDGSFRRSSIQEPQQSASQTNNQPEQPQVTVNSGYTLQKESVTAGSFLRNLLPKGMDTGDLIIVLLLLLIAGDSEENHNTALLTLALYFFM